jgi:hypothetical protein
MKYLVILALALAGTAHAQTAWNADTVSWEAPTTCNDGTPISNCPVTGYRVETAASKAATTWTLVTTTAANVLTANATGLTAGPHCYRVIATSAFGNSAATVQGNDCPVAVPPTPGPPGNVRTVETTVFNLRQKGREVLLGSAVGTVNLDTICGKVPFVENHYTVARSNVRFTTPQTAGTVLVAKCG